MPCPYCNKPTPREKYGDNFKGTRDSTKTCIVWFCPKDPKNKDLYVPFDKKKDN